MGFFFPMAVWLKDALKEQSEGWLAAVGQQGWLQPANVQAITRQFQADQIQWSRLWALIALGAVTTKGTSVSQRSLVTSIQ